MTAEQYLAQNALGFEGDTILEQAFRDLIKKHDIKTVCETGSYMGATARKIADMGVAVVTIEVNPQYYQQAQGVHTINRPTYLFGNSVDVLPEAISKYVNGNTIYWLDAHWQAHNPLLEELKIIADHKLRPVIIIHDFKVPDHPELGYDSYNGQDYDWEWIKDSVEEIYGKDGYTYHYNSEATGAKRGVIFIEPK